MVGVPRVVGHWCEDCRSNCSEEDSPVTSNILSIELREVVRSKPKNVQEKSGETTRDRPMMRTRRIYRGVAKATKGTKKSRTKHSVHQFFCPIAINTKRMPRISAGRKGKNITRVPHIVSPVSIRLCPFTKSVPTSAPNSPTSGGEKLSK